MFISKKKLSKITSEMEWHKDELKIMKAHFDRLRVQTMDRPIASIIYTGNELEIDDRDPIELHGISLLERIAKLENHIGIEIVSSTEQAQTIYQKKKK